MKKIIINESIFTIEGVGDPIIYPGQSPNDEYHIEEDFRYNISNYLINKGFEYINRNNNSRISIIEKLINKTKTKDIGLNLIQMVIINKIGLDYEDMEKEVKLIYKKTRNKNLKIFKEEMEDKFYWRIIEKDLHKIIGINNNENKLELIL